MRHPDHADPPTVLAFTTDLFLIPRLEDAARALGFRLEVGAAGLGAGGEEERAVDLTEPLEGEDGAFVRSIVTDPPALLLFDLGSSGIPWERRIHILKTSSATRRIPIVAFGPHVESKSLDRARSLGAERVVTRGQFQSGLAEILEAEARPPDARAISEGCRRPPSQPALEGISFLRSGAYFKAHEHLERAILDEPGPEGTVYRTLLHLPVALLHTERGNWRGAQKMLLRMRPWLASLPSLCRGVDMGSVRAALEGLQERLDRWHSGDEPPPTPPAPPDIVLANPP